VRAVLLLAIPVVFAALAIGLVVVVSRATLRRRR
jgi:flagellar biosynthesis protein FliQ